MSNLYQKALIEHHKSPFGFEVSLNVSHQASGENLACGDEINITVETSDDIIVQVAFHGESCAICRASASILCKTIRNKTLKDAKVMLQNVQNQLQNKETTTELMLEDFSPLIAVKAYPVRLQCAKLPWATFERAFS